MSHNKALKDQMKKLDAVADRLDRAFEKLKNSGTRFCDYGGDDEGVMKCPICGSEARSSGPTKPYTCFCGWTSRTNGTVRAL